MAVKVVVRGCGVNMTIDLCDTEEQLKSITVLQLEERIKTKHDFGKGEICLALVCKKKILHRDSTPLSEYGIQPMSLIKICGMLILPEAQVIHAALMRELDRPMD